MSYVMVDRLSMVVLRLCECCWTDCDCGCVTTCPLHRARSADAPPLESRGSEGSKR